MKFLNIPRLSLGRGGGAALKGQINIVYNRERLLVPYSKLALMYTLPTLWYYILCEHCVATVYGPHAD